MTAQPKPQPTAIALALGLALAGAAAPTASAASAASAAGAGAVATPAVPGTVPTSVTVLDTVQATGHYDNAVGTFDAASQGTVNGVLLQDIPLLRPGEVLETVPGLVVTQHSGDGKANQYFLRGYNLDHGTDLASFLDGVPVNMPTHAHGQGYSDLNCLIPELVDRINYLKGPYFASAGDFSAAGAVDIHYRDSLPRPFADLTIGQEGYRRLLLAGSAPVGRFLAGVTGAPGKSLVTPGTAGAVEAPAPTGTDAGPVLLAALEVLAQDGPWVNPEGLHKTNGLLRLSDGSALRGWSADVQLYDAQWNSTDQVPLSLITSGALPRFGAVDPSDGGRSGRAILSGEWHRQDADGYQRVSAFVEHSRLQLFSNFTLFENRESLSPVAGNPPVFAPDPLRPTDQFEQFEQRNTLGTGVLQGWNHHLLGHDSTTEVGLQGRYDFVHVGLLDTQSRIPFHTVGDDQEQVSSLGVYVQNTTTWTPWLRSLLGLREQRVSLAQTDALYAQNTAGANGNLLLPKLALILGPWDRTEFFLNAGQGVHSNDARGVINQIDPTTGAAATGATTLVRATGYEVGARTEAIDGLQTSFALWALNSDSELVYNADSDIGSTSANGASRRYGIEWNNHLQVGRQLLVDADVAWTHARYAAPNANGAPGDQIPNAVPVVALIRATLRDLGPWTLSLEERYLGAYPASQDGSIQAPSSLVTNLRLQRVLTPDIKVSLDLLNVFNTSYYDIVYQQDYRVSPTAQAVATGTSVHPGEPREVRVNLQLAF